jgi:hypothetical protein
MYEINTQEEFEKFVRKTFFAVFNGLNDKTIKKWDELKEMAEIVRVEENREDCFYILDVIPHCQSLSKVSVATVSTKYTMLMLRDMGLCEIKDGYISFKDKIKIDLIN